MISIELLRRYPHFYGISENCLREVALISEECNYKSGEEIFKESGTFLATARIYEQGKEATHLMLLTEGEVDIFFTMGGGKKVVVGDLVGGDLMAISALLPPYHLTASGVAKKDCKVIKIEAKRLRELCDQNPELGYRLMQSVAKSLKDRLENTRVELAGQA
jgi:CRP-like cAMP-binding protein